ncbi:MAG: peptidylprolyl isomerase [Clostridia bacterium]|nr:peptidylprolyl isomerase [Clostridia bacterium]MBP3652402.1 peptidylprolyl isomerase [Clostridia bacterium]
MKKLIAIIALLALICTLTGCGQEENPLAGIPNPEVTIHLSNGSDMRFELFVQEAPNTVANFVQLAKSGFYEGMTFFRVVPGVLIQSGDPRNNGTGNAGYLIQGEFAENGIENSVAHTRGTISMARQSDYDTASSQFFIMQGNYPEYNGQYAAFGRATDEASLAAIDKIASTVVDSNYYPVGSVPTIKSIDVETHGYRYEAATMEIPEEEEEKK